MITRNEIYSIAEKFPMSSRDCPFTDDFDTTVLRHSDSKKWFGLVFEAPYCRLNIKKDGNTDIINIKCDPLFKEVLFENFDWVVPAYHMNKNHWISVILERVSDKNEFSNLLFESYLLTLGKKSREKLLKSLDRTRKDR